MPDSTLVLVVDDDPAEREVLKASFQEAGFCVADAEDEEGALAVLLTKSVQLVTLDLKAGHHSRLALARKIKSIHNIPVIIITSEGEPHQRLEGLEHGADDYVVKPFRPREAVLRARKALERYAPLTAPDAPRSRYSFDSSVLDTKARILRHLSGGTVELTETEYQLLELFLQHPDRVLSRDELWKMLRGHEWSPLDRAIDGHVSRLRHKMTKAGEDMIRSVRGIGYVFTGNVIRI